MPRSFMQKIVDFVRVEKKHSAWRDLRVGFFEHVTYQLNLRLDIVHNNPTRYYSSVTL